MFNTFNMSQKMALFWLNFIILFKFFWSFEDGKKGGVTGAHVPPQ